MNPKIERRDFHQLSLAAWSGVIATTTPLSVAFGEPAKTPPQSPAKSQPETPSDAPANENGQPAKPPQSPAKDDKREKPKPKPKPKELHLCRGLNTCKGQGRTGENDCAGQGQCATTPNSPHSCATLNACKGQGGGNGSAGQNACDGQGDGPVPLEGEGWETLRKQFEAKMRRLSKKFGTAPPSDDDEASRKRWEAAERKAKEEAAKGPMTSDPKETPKTPAPKKPAPKKKVKTKEIHLCRGLNTCEGQGKSGDNECAGRGTCATTPASPHECKGKNACKGQGGCETTAGKNLCKTMGLGRVPVTDEVKWDRLRKQFEARMTRLRKKFGKPPEAKPETPATDTPQPKPAATKPATDTPQPKPTPIKPPAAK